MQNPNCLPACLLIFSALAMTKPLLPESNEYQAGAPDYFDVWHEEKFFGQEA